MKIKLSKKQWEDIGTKTGWIKEAQFQDKMMPGQTPYTPEEKAQVSGLINDANKAQQVHSPEELEAEDKNRFRRRQIKVTFSDGDTVDTSINGTVDEILKYYLPNGRGVEADYDINQPNKTRRPVKVEFLS